MFDAVVKYGQDKWSQIGEILGFSIAEPNGLTCTHPGCDAKLRALISEKKKRLVLHKLQRFFYCMPASKQIS
jgi:hypothetical protein